MVLVPPDAQIHAQARRRPPRVVVEERVLAEVRALTAHEDRVVLDRRRVIAEEDRIDARALYDRRRAEDAVIAAGLVVVDEPLVVERVVPEHHVVRPGALGGQEVRALHEEIVVVALLSVAGAAESRRPIALASALVVDEQRAVDQIRGGRTHIHEAEVPRRVLRLDEEVRPDDACVGQRQEILGDLVVVEAVGVHDVELRVVRDQLGDLRERSLEGLPGSRRVRRLALVALRPFGEDAGAVVRRPGEVVLDHRFGDARRIIRNAAGDAGHGDLAHETGVELIGATRRGKIHQPLRRLEIFRAAQDRRRVHLPAATLFHHQALDRRTLVARVGSRDLG